MAEHPYRVTLTVPYYASTFWGGDRSGIRAVATDVQAWLDLSDRHATALQAWELVRLNGGTEDSFEAYSVLVHDMVTGERVATIQPSLTHLREAWAQPPKEGDPGPPPAFRLDQVSDQALLAEVARRMGARP